MQGLLSLSLAAGQGSPGSCPRLILVNSLVQPKSGNKQQGFVPVIDGPVALERVVIFCLVQQTWKGGNHNQSEHVEALAVVADWYKVGTAGNPLGLGICSRGL